MVNTEPDKFAERLNLRGQYVDESLNSTISYVATRIPAGFVLIFLAGLVSGLLGVGGGTLKVLGMGTLMRLPFKVSTTTSNFMIGVTAAASTGIMYFSGFVNVLLAAPVALGVVVGSVAGASLLMRSKPASVRTLFIVVLIVFGAEMIFRGISH